MHVGSNGVVGLMPVGPLACLTTYSHSNKSGRAEPAHLKGPVSDVGQRGEGVVADVLTSRLSRVAGELAVFIAVDALASHRRQHDAEDQQHGEPHLPHEGGVVGDLVQ